MIALEHISKTINGQPILTDINLRIEDGTILVILGGSGAGKTVIMQHMVGLLKPDAGVILVDDVDITKLSDKELLVLRRQMGYLFQEGALYDFMSVFDNVAFPLREHSKLKESEISDKVKEMLLEVGLEKSAAKFPSELSGGMKKRAALARAVILGTKILFCDEPTSGLDPILSRDITDLIRDITRKIKCTTIMTSHDIQNSLRIADQLVVVVGGKIIARGTREELERSTDPIVKDFLK